MHFAAATHFNQLIRYEGNGKLLLYFIQFVYTHKTSNFAYYFVNISLVAYIEHDVQVNINLTSKNNKGLGSVKRRNTTEKTYLGFEP